MRIHGSRRTRRQEVCYLHALQDYVECECRCTCNPVMWVEGRELHAQECPEVLPGPQRRLQRRPGRLQRFQEQLHKWTSWGRVLMLLLVLVMPWLNFIDVRHLQ